MIQPDNRFYKKQWGLFITNVHKTWALLDYKKK